MRGRFSTIDPEALRVMIEEETLTQREAAEKIGCSASAIERACKRLGLKTQRTGPRNGARHPGWKGGRILIGRYWYIWAGADHAMATQAGYVAEHRLLMAAKLERPLRQDEVVHHIDGDPNNNDLENLMLFGSNSDHLRHELTGRVPNWSEEGRARMLEAVRGPKKPRSSTSLDVRVQREKRYR
jgi:hypothetical protein